ncbi:hypothetical protein FE257_004855 [Aspergillus nanangensis]|uniref:HpcH/HpaI aldolase/citrate lyase domain-containing protein n=1 Tax=Aspergillus nanangensis TaxID=2582783 RepID=A0AAD4GMC4_ASPNN|nr:hypothetical protein FE257_004855 [Aspergillus nanangensis]
MSFSTRAGQEPLLGAYLSIESTSSAHIMGRAGFDWLLIDMEHAPLSARETTSLVHAIAVGSHGKCASLVRIPAIGVEWVKWALDSGATGIVAPMVQSKEEAERLARFARYPPLGERSFRPFNAPWADLSLDSSVQKYLSTTSRDIAVIAMIESRAGGADGQEPEYVQALERIVRIARREKIGVGIFSATPEALKVHLAMGFNFVLVAGDSTALMNGATMAMDSASETRRGIKL